MAVKNAMDARSLLSVVDGAYVEVEKNLQRYREILIYAKNDTLSESDRNALFEEAKQLALENERIHETTTWGSQSVFAQDNSSVTSFTYQIVWVFLWCLKILRTAPNLSFWLDHRPKRKIRFP